MDIKNLAPVSNDSKNLALLTWLGMIFLGVLLPLVVYLIKTDDDFLREHAKAALNWSITAFIGMFIGGILAVVVVGFVLIAVIGICNVVFAILGAVAASRGEFYVAPFTWQLIK